MANDKLITSILVAVFLLSFFASSQEQFTFAVSASDDWPMFHHDPAQTGYTNSSAPSSTPTELWQTGPRGDLLTSPAIVNGIVYMTGYDLYAINASTGETIWEQRDQGSPAPIVENGIVYTRNGAFNASTGTQIWKIKGLHAVTVADGYYYTVSKTIESSGNHYLVALNATSGDLIWKKPGSIWSSPAVAEGYLYFGINSGVLAIDAHTGNKLWDCNLGTTVQFSPTISNGYVYAHAINENICCINASTGAKVWNYTMKNTGSSASCPAVAYGLVYVGSGDGNVYCFNASTGEKIWNYMTLNIDEFYFGVESSPAVADGVVFVGANDGYLYALDAFTGNKLWSYKMGEPQALQCSPAIANGCVYMGSTSNFLIALGTSTPAMERSSPEVVFIVLILSVLLTVGIVGVLLFKKLRKKQYRKRV